MDRGCGINGLNKDVSMRVEIDLWMVWSSFINVIFCVMILGIFWVIVKVFDRLEWKCEIWLRV